MCRITLQSLLTITFTTFTTFTAAFLFLSAETKLCAQSEGECASKSDSKSDLRPNFLVIAADDMGYSDLGCYGGEIQTPHLDSLAHEGVRFAAFYNTTRCWASRSGLMTGYYPQQLNVDPRGKPFPGWITYLPQHLKNLGYKNYQSGKWHVTCAPKVLNAGFDESYEILDHNRHFNPQQHRMNDKPFPPIEKGTDFYSTDFIANTTIEQLKQHVKKSPNTPFFAYTAFIVPHFPLMAPDEDIARYSDVYKVGWDATRSRRLERMKQLGIYTGNLSAREEQIGPPYAFKNLDVLGPGEILRPAAWETLTEEQKTFQAAKMSVHAAMVDRMDQGIGRILEQLREMGALENTVIFFLSDNGASAEVMIRGDGHNPLAQPGSAESFLCLGPGFSNASNTPFRRHKTWVHEGGISTPLVVYVPERLRNGVSAGSITPQNGHLIDLAPTILELAGASPDVVCGPTAKRYPGKSLAKVLTQGVLMDRGDLYFSHEGNRALISKGWKIVMARCDQTPGTPIHWELYDLRCDRAEQHDLSLEQPERVREMAARWEALDAQFQSDKAEK